MKIENISSSGFNTYSWCEWKYYLQYILQEQDSAGSSALLGTISHKALELVSRAVILKRPKDSKIWNFEYLWQICFNHYYNKESKIAEGIDNSRLKKVCKGLHELIKGPHSPYTDKTIAAEIKFAIPLQEPKFKIPGTDKYFTIRGWIDRVDKIDDETVEIIDYKSGSADVFGGKRRKKLPTDLYKEIQPKLYYLAGTTLFPWAKNILVSFIYFSENITITVPFCSEDIKTTKGILLDRFNHIKKNDNPQPNKSWKCNVMCAFGKNGSCNRILQEQDELGREFVQNKYTILNVRRKS